MTETLFEEEEELRLALVAHGRLHDCKEAECQVYPDGSRRRNPRPGEPDAAPGLAHLAEKDQLAKEAVYTRPELSARVKELLAKYKPGSVAAVE